MLLLTNSCGEPFTVNASIALLQLLGFAAGFIAMRFYAGMARVKPGRKPVLFAAIYSWALVYLPICLGVLPFKLVPNSLVTVVALSSVCELVAAAFVGAWIYEESRAASERAVPAT